MPSDDLERDVLQKSDAARSPACDSDNASDSSFDADALHMVNPRTIQEQEQQTDSFSDCSSFEEKRITASIQQKEGYSGSGEGGPLERDLNRLAASLQSTHTAGLFGGSASNVQRPLQIHLDVAAVEHGIGTQLERQNGSTSERQGLFSHYLQLADVDQKRERLEKRPRRQKPPGYEASQAFACEQNRRHGRNRKLMQLQNRFVRSRLLPRGRQIGFSANIDTCSQQEPTGTDIRRGDAVANVDRSVEIGHTSDKQQHSDTQNNNTLRVDQGAISPNCNNGVSPANTNALDNVHRQEPRVDDVKSPISDIDLTQFLPYALSAPGIQSMAGSPQASQFNSSKDITEWLRRKGHLLGAMADTTKSADLGNTEKDNMVQESALEERRARLLEGIQQLLLHQRFICLLARAMMQYGAPLHHLEDNLTRMARHLCIAATFTTMPGLVLISIEDTSTFTSETKIIRCPNGFDMHRLELTDSVFRKVSKGEMSIEGGTAGLIEIMDMPPLFAWYWQLIVWGMSSWSVCLLAFSGSWMDSLVAFVLGMAAGCLNLIASRLKGFTNLFEVTVSIVSGFFATVFEKWTCFGAVTLSATVVLLPGLLLTTGVIELASRNMHAGTIRAAYALMIAFVIAFGINLGNSIFVEIFSRLDRKPDMNISVCSPVSQWWWWLAFPVAISSICLLINVHPRHWHACLIVAGVMFAVFWVLVIHLQLSIIGPVVSAFVLGLAANIWSKFFKHNAYATMLPGMMILVPGSVGVRGIMSMFSGTSDGSSTALAVQMAQTSLSVMVGLFASSFVVYPRGKKQSALLTV